MDPPFFAGFDDQSSRPVVHCHRSLFFYFVFQALEYGRLLCTQRLQNAKDQIMNLSSNDNTSTQQLGQDECITPACTNMSKGRVPLALWDGLPKEHILSAKTTEDNEEEISEEQRLEELRLACHSKARSFCGYISKSARQLIPQKTPTSPNRRRCHSEPASSDLFQLSDEKELQLRRSTCEANVKKLYEERKPHVQDLFQNSWILVSEDLEEKLD